MPQHGGFGIGIGIGWLDEEGAGIGMGLGIGIEEGIGIEWSAPLGGVAGAPIGIDGLDPFADAGAAGMVGAAGIADVIVMAGAGVPRAASGAGVEPHPPIVPPAIAKSPRIDIAPMARSLVMVAELSELGCVRRKVVDQGGVRPISASEMPPAV